MMPETKQKSKSLTDVTFSVVDLETTGFSTENNEIIEIGIVKVKNFKQAEEFSSFVKPKKKVDLKILGLTGTDHDLLMNEPTIEQLSKRITDFVSGTILVEHSVAKFDVRFLERFVFKSENVPHISTYRIAKKLYPDEKHLKLVDLAEILKLSQKNHHQAIDDARITAKIFISMLKNIYDSKIARTLDELNNFLQK